MAENAVRRVLLLESSMDLRGRIHLLCQGLMKTA